MQSRELSVEVKPIIPRLEKKEIHQRDREGETERGRIQPDAAKLIGRVFPVHLDNDPKYTAAFEFFIYGASVTVKIEKNYTRKCLQWAKKWNIVESLDLEGFQASTAISCSTFSTES